ncbi:MAG TPA: aromatic amino acid lyase [Actinomycetota bacterium]|jgi:histidine ammonia-lyase|nr:aromatic amino acid lyase [Actinomycetota bacterium]
MTVVVEGLEDVTLDALRRVAFSRELARFSDDALARIAEAHNSFARYVAAHQDEFIYGITSGLGPEASKRRSLAETQMRRSRPIHWEGIAFGGAPLPEHVSRGAVFAAFASIASGHAAVHPDVALAVASLLDGDLPSLPSLGLTAAGELMPNSILMPLLPPDERVSAGWGFDTQAAMAGIAALVSRRRLRLAEHVFALCIDAFQAPLDAYDTALVSAWIDPHEGEALVALAFLLERADDDRRPFQAPVSYRILPRLIGQAHRAIEALEEIATIALRADNSNPTYLLPTDEHPSGRALSNGGFHHASATPALDAVGASWANLGILAHHFAVTMHRGDISLLPDRLFAEGEDVVSGRSTSYLEYVPSGAVDEMRRLAHATLLPLGVGASQQDDIGITTPEAFLTERRIGECFDLTLAVLAVVASQALHVTGRAGPPALRGFLGSIRTAFPPVKTPRRIGVECAALTETFSAAIGFGDTPFTDVFA